METKVALIAIIVSDKEASARLNEVLHEHSEYIIGRMGLPHRSSDKYIINVMLEGPVSEIEALSHRLSLIPDISVKTTYE